MLVTLAGSVGGTKIGESQFSSFMPEFNPSPASRVFIPDWEGNEFCRDLGGSES